MLSLDELIAECAGEPIHTPGGVQPFGVLLACDLDGTIRQVSANAGSIWLGPPEELLGQRIDSHFATALASRIVQLWIDSAPGTVTRVGSHRSSLDERSWQVTAHRIDGVYLIELVPEVEAETSHGEWTSLAGRLGSTESVETFAQAVCDHLRTATAFDRVMVYRFDPDWHGQVIAEARAAELEPYLGLRYPASDIPPQARQLYQAVRVRVLADTDAEPSPLLPHVNPSTGRPLDLSFVSVRALSPVHRQYLRNMRVRATHVTSVIHDGRMWGLIACHHRTPRMPVPQWGVTTTAMADLMDTAVTLADSRARSRGTAFAQSLLRTLPDLLSGETSLGAGLIDPHVGLMEFLSADGLVVVHRGELSSRGAVPTSEVILRLVDWLEATGERLYSTDRLGLVEPTFAAEPAATGLLALHIPNSLQGWVLWFRREESRTVRWAGDQRKGVARAADAVRLSPRASFAEWVEEVRGRSRAWTPVELAMASEVIRPNLLEVVATAYLKQAETLRRYQSILFEQVHDAVIVTDLDGVVTFWNQGATRTLGWTADEMLGRHILDRLPPDRRPRAADILADVRDGTSFSGRFRDAHKDGRTVWLDLRLSRIHDETGRFIGIMGASRDVTGLKAAEDKLRLKDAIVGTARDNILVTEAEPLDAPGPRIIYANPSLLRSTGYSEAEVLGRSPRMFQGPNTDRAALDRIRANLKAWQPIREELINYRKDGTEFWIELDIIPLADDHGWYTHWIGIQRDITERKRGELALRASERFLRTVIDTTAECIKVVDADGRLIQMNRAGLEMIGVDEAAVVGRCIYDVLAPEHRDRYAEFIRRVVGGEAETSVFDIVRADGQRRTLESSAVPLDLDGRTVHLAATRDVTDRMAAEAALRASEERYRLLFEANPQPMWVYDLATLGFLAVNDAAVVKYGYPRAEFLRLTLRDIRPDDDLPALAANLAAGTDGYENAGVWRHRLRDGRVIRVRIISHSLQFDGRPARVVLAQDVTEQLRAEDELRASEERLRLALAAGRMGTFDWDVESGRLVWSPSHYELFGYPQGDPFEVTSTHFTDRIHPDDHPQLRARLIAARDTHTEFTDEFRIRLPDGRTRWIQSIGRFHYDAAGRPVRMVGVDIDVTDRKTAEADLVAATEQYRLLADHAADVITLIDAAGTFLYVSPSSVRLTGYQPDGLIGVEDVHPDDQAAVADSRAANFRGEPTRLEWRVKRSDGSYVWVESASKPVVDDNGAVRSIIVSTRDISRRKRLEEQMRQAQKLEAIGQLAGGVAHDFNNLLTVVNGCCEMLLADTPADHPHRPLLASILRAGDRGAGLTRQLLAFGRQQMLVVEAFDPTAVARDALRMLARLLGEDVAIIDLLADAGFVRGDPGQFEQVLMNLAVNARDAMPRGGRLTVQTDAVDVAAVDLPTPDARPGEYIRLTVRDTGTGIPLEVRNKLFEPFFTTKPAGKGTGLGLATVYGIVRQSNGFLTVESELGVGTAFHVFWPRCPAPEPTATVEPARPRAAVGGETILVVEDDDSVRMLTTVILERYGYAVVTAESGEDAIRVCDSLDAPPDLVMTDVVMPGMSGRELAETLALKYPRLKIVFLSGYTADTVTRYGIEGERVAFLQKPYTADSLGRFVREVLGR